MLEAEQYSAQLGCLPRRLAKCFQQALPHTNFAKILFTTVLWLILVHFQPGCLRGGMIDCAMCLFPTAQLSNTEHSQKPFSEANAPNPESNRASLQRPETNENFNRISGSMASMQDDASLSETEHCHGSFHQCLKGGMEGQDLFDSEPLEDLSPISLTQEHEPEELLREYGCIFQHLRDVSRCSEDSVEGVLRQDVRDRGSLPASSVHSSEASTVIVRSLKRPRVSTLSFDIDHAILFEPTEHDSVEYFASPTSQSSSYCRSIDQFLQMHGPYQGWYIDEYMPHLRHDGSSSSSSLHSSASAPAESDDDAQNSNREMFDDFPFEAFWEEWTIDSDGHLHQRDSSRPNSPISDFSDVPSVNLLSIYADSEDASRDLPRTPSSHDSLRSHIYAAVEDDPDDQPEHKRFQGGAKGDSSDQPGFVPTAAEISKLMQRLKKTQHGFQPKQIPMLLISDSKFLAKIKRTDDSKQLCDCIAAAAKRMGLTASVTSPTLEPKAAHPKPDLVSSAGSNGKGKGQNKGSSGKGKGIDDKQIQLNITGLNSKGKGKGKVNRDPVKISLAPHGWNVFPQDEFQQSFGAVYLCEKEDDARTIAELAFGKSYPIGVVSPQPFQIGQGQPEPLFVEAIREHKGETKTISLQGYLHQLTEHPVTYKKAATSVELKRPDISKTIVLYVNFSDEGSSAQTRVDLNRQSGPAAKLCMQSILQTHESCRHVEILDAWNVQQKEVFSDHKVYQVSVRVKQDDAEKLLIISGPGKIQVNGPGSIKERMQHIWLKDNGRAIGKDKVQEVLKRFHGQHLGAFELRGTWAIRATHDKIQSIKESLGKNDEPAYFLSNCSPEWDVEDIQEILKQMKWIATVREGDRRWKQGSCVWMVRAAKEPSVWACPINFGYERRMLRIASAKKATSHVKPPVQVPTYAFNSWGAQFRRQSGAKLTQTMSYAQMLMKGSTTNKRPAHDMDARQSHADMECDYRQSSSTDDNETSRALEAMRAENAELKQQISTLMAQVSQLVAQLNGQQAVAQPVPPNSPQDDL